MQCVKALETGVDTLRQLYSVISIPTMGRMAKNRKVKESAETVWLNMVSKGASLRSAAGLQLTIG